MLTVQEFWNNIDRINPYRTLGALANASGMDYHRLTQQRSRGYMPKPEDLIRLSDATKHTIEALLLGTDERKQYAYSKRTERIANRCEFTATDTQLFMVEQILGIVSDYIVVEKKGRESSGKNSTTA